MKTLNINLRNAVIESMASLLDANRGQLLDTNVKDVENYEGGDPAFLQRLSIDNKKIDGMISSLEKVAALPDPLHQTKSEFQHANGLHIRNLTAPFGRILIIYESRPDVTVEAAVIGFKAGNKILLKGGKESIHSNLLLTQWWQKALQINHCATDYIEYLEISRKETIPFLENPTPKVDLIIPRGGDGLIQLVKKHAKAPVLTSGRGNNFMYIDISSPNEEAIAILKNAKFQKISACNALDKVLVQKEKLKDPDFIELLQEAINTSGGIVYAPEILGETTLSNFQDIRKFEESLWNEEFLSNEIVIYPVENVEEAINLINKHSGGHSASILTEDKLQAQQFLEEIDSAAVYHNASTRFTDGGEFGLGAEIGIGTEKLHHRGPLGLEHLVTNKWWVQGNGQTR